MTTWMIVEDEPDIYELLLATFEMWGVNGIAFVDGQEAVRWIEDVEAGSVTVELPEFGLFDIRLPGNLNGNDVAERIRRSPRLRHMVIVLATAYRMTVEIEHEMIKQSGAVALWHKPLPTSTELRKMIEDLVARSRPPH